MNRPGALGLEADAAAGVVSASVPLGLVHHAPARRQPSRLSRSTRLHVPMVAADVVALGCAIAAGAATGGGLALPGTGLVGQMLLLAIGLPFWSVIARLNGLYRIDDWRSDHGTADELGRLVPAVALWVFAVLAGGSLAGLLGAVDAPALVAMAGVAVLALAGGRAVVRGWARRRVWYWQNALVIGRPTDATPFIQRILRSPRYGINVVGLVDPVKRRRFASDERRYVGPVPVVDETHSIEEIVHSVGVDRVVVIGALDPLYEREVVCNLADLGVHVDLMPTWTEAYGGRLDVHTLGGVPVLTAPNEALGQASVAAKRAMDVVVSGAALLVLSPLLALCALAIRLDSPGPVLFRQRRVGKDDRRFSVVKFRSMYLDAEERKAQVAMLNFHGGGMATGMFKVRQDPRITRVGAFLRRSSLDELPQLVNVLRGDMSLVGPRPLIETEHSQIPATHRRRVALKPGLTGLWQVHGRSEIPFDEMVALDCLYVRSWSLAGDLKLLMRTVSAVLRRQGAY